NRLRSHGFEIWLDDFGSGHSSLNVLKDYDFDVLKVDMDFLRRGFERKSKGTPKYEKAKKLLAVIAEMTRSLGIRSLVEGIDESDQHEYLRTLGFGLLQGFYFGQPAPAPGAIVQNEKFEHYEGDMPICQA
ncbi:MAG: EAL domain-containing protein, partial [Atopobiaceae bacterium]|nr:EAL domain-containing protein [Atopobiaceae bacterium]